MPQRSNFITSDLHLSGEQGGDITSKRIHLLEQIDTLGSISAAAKQSGISYRSAWDAVDEMNNLWDSPLVAKSPGGAQGGGTQLTAEGRRLIESFRIMQREYRQFTQALARDLGDMQRMQQHIRRLSMRTSARNQFQGKVILISSGPVNTEVSLAINDIDRITAIITSESVEQLGLSLGREAYALIKSSFIILAPEDANLISSARNRLCGSLRELRHGAVNSEAVIELDGGKTLTAVITEESARAMGLDPGSRVCALIKASHVILGVN
ncbi:MAG: TOBE domain-containing protein [Candidatus Thiodiazotropha sp.]